MLRLLGNYILTPQNSLLWFQLDARIAFCPRHVLASVTKQPPSWPGHKDSVPRKTSCLGQYLEGLLESK